MFRESHSTTDDGKLFHVVTFLCAKLFLLKSNIVFGASNINQYPSCSYSIRISLTGKIKFYNKREHNRDRYLVNSDFLIVITAYTE